MWKRRAAALLIALLGLAFCAQGYAQEMHAATQTRAPLLDAPREDAHELMRYYIGVRVEVVREVDEQYVQVNVGQPGGSLMGYMRKADLAFEEETIRALPVEDARCELQEEQTCKLYAYPDERSNVIDPACMPAVHRVLGMLDSTWIHLQLYDGRTGFINRADLSGEQVTVAQAIYFPAIPTDEEFSAEEATAYVRSVLLESENVDDYMGKSGEKMDEAKLNACVPEVEILYYPENPDCLEYVVSFRSAEGYIYAGFSFTARGREVLGIHAGNG